MIMMYQSQGQMVRVIFSKTDLYGVPTGIIYELLYQLGVRYHCYRESDELDFLCELLKKQFVVLSGYSGAGKSTFMNYLDNNLQLKTNPLTAKNTGKHTTTTSCIYEVKNIK